MTHPNALLTPRARIRLKRSSHSSCPSPVNPTDCRRRVRGVPTVTWWLWSAGQMGPVAAAGAGKARRG